jgi:hypothetical protein
MEDHSHLEERADFLNDSEINNWTASTKKFKMLVEKAIERSSLLFVGPRGCGKTHLFRYAHLQTKENRIFSVYSTFGGYYSLEPFLSSNTNAQRLFHVWVLCKIIDCTYTEISARSQNQDLPNHPLLSLEMNNIIKSFIGYAEKGVMPLDNDEIKLISELSIASVQALLEACRVKVNCSHIILYLDDAALTLTPEYLIEFFDIIRSLKSKTINIKAAVYPGTTEYGPRFHIGQDAKTVNVWDVGNLDNESLIEEMSTGRLIESVEGINPDILKLLRFSAFGVPRAFLNLLYAFKSENGASQVKFNFAIESQTSLLLREYESLSKKLPQYTDIVSVGRILFENAIGKLKSVNLSFVDSTTNQLCIAIQIQSNENNVLQNRLVQFLVEAGLLFDHGIVSHGDNRKYNRYQVHTAFLLKERVFSGKSRGFNASEMIKFIVRQQEKHPERFTMSTLVGATNLDRIHLNLPSCKKCNAPRTKESQKFCYECGEPMVNESKYKACLQIPIDQLPLTKWRIEQILQTSLKTVGDFLVHPNTATELRKRKGIGPVRASEIDSKVRQCVAEFLS